jgi:hypothetical protein
MRINTLVSQDDNSNISNKRNEEDSVVQHLSVNPNA